MPITESRTSRSWTLRTRVAGGTPSASYSAESIRSDASVERTPTSSPSTASTAATSAVTSRTSRVPRASGSSRSSRRRASAPTTCVPAGRGPAKNHASVGDAKPGRSAFSAAKSVS
jgi:hypothetical protein